MNAYEQVKMLAESKAKSIYGDTIPAEVTERLDWELCSIEKNNTAKYFLAAQELVKESEKLGYSVFTRGEVSSSLVSFLLEITEPNPLVPHYVCPECQYSEFYVDKFCGVDLENKICPKCGAKLKKDGFNLPAEFFMGLDGEKKLEIYLNIAPEICDKITAKLEKMSEFEPNITQVIKIPTHDVLSFLKKLELITGKKHKEILIDDQDTLKLLKCNKGCGVCEFGSRFTRSIIDIAGIDAFDDLIRISSISHGTDTWLTNASDIIKNKIATLTEVISTREDIMLYLMKMGIDRKTAFEITDKVRKGQYCVDTTRKVSHIDEEIKIMLNHGVPKWYIESCEKIQYLFPRSHAVGYALAGYRTAYYKAHYPLEFYCTYLSINADTFTVEMLTSDRRYLEEKIKESVNTRWEDYDSDHDVINSDLWQKAVNQEKIMETCIEILEAGYKIISDKTENVTFKEFIIRDGKIYAVTE